MESMPPRDADTEVALLSASVSAIFLARPSARICPGDGKGPPSSCPPAPHLPAQPITEEVNHARPPLATELFNSS
jgi:hypothetical protein